MRRGLKADFALVTVTLLWGISFVVIKITLADVPPFWLLTFRFLIAAGALVLAFPRLWKAIRRDVVFPAVAISACLFTGFALQTLGLELTTPSKSGFITGATILFVPILGRTFFQSRIEPAAFAGVLIASSGLLLLTRPTGLSEINPGDVLTLGSSCAFALHILLLGRYTMRIPPHELATLQVLFVALYSLAGAVIFETPPAEYSLSTLASLVYLGLFCSGVAFFVQTYAQRFTPPTRTALIFAMEPIFAALASLLFLGEEIGLVGWLGGTAIVAGVIVGEWPMLKSKSERKPNSLV